MKEVDLGRKMPEMPEPVDSDSGEERVHYPSVYLEDVGALKDLPDEGTVTFKYEITSRSTNERDGKKSCCVSLDLLSLVNAEGEKPKGKSASDSFDEAADSVAKDEGKDESADEDDY